MYVPGSCNNIKLIFLDHNPTGCLKLYFKVHIGFDIDSFKKLSESMRVIQARSQMPSLSRPNRMLGEGIRNV